MSFLQELPNAVVLGPMTKGSNLPYRRLCVELGARLTVSEMTVARRLKQKRRSEFALIRRAPDEPCFGVQLAGNQPDEMAWAAELAVSRGADFVDVNLGCPIEYFTSKGLGAALARQPKRVRRIVEEMVRAVAGTPVTVKVRLGWNAGSLNYLDVANAAVDGGAAAVFVHGRTRDARYKSSADWSAVAALVRSVPVAVIGNGDLLFPHEVEAARGQSGCAAVMVARGALIKPWLYRELTEGYRDLSADERLAVYRRYVGLALEHWGGDERGRAQVADFTRWHFGFWCRYAPRRADGSWPTMQERESVGWAETPLDRLLVRQDEAAHAWLTERLIAGDAIDPDAAPAPSAAEENGRRGSVQVSG
jgi:tRNA-dihydrouridine synthase 3